MVDSAKPEQPEPVEIFDNILVVGRDGCMRTPVACAFIQNGLYEGQVHASAIDPGEEHDIRAIRMAAAWDMKLDQFEPKAVTKVLVENCDLIIPIDGQVEQALYKRGYDSRMLGLKVMPFNKWIGGLDVPVLGPRDPDGDFETETEVLEQIHVLAESWTHKLQGKAFPVEEFLFKH